MPYTAITRDSRHPFETYLLVGGVIAGCMAVFGGLWPSAIASVFDPLMQRIWGGFFGGGAATALIGIALRTRRDVGIFMEQVGLIAFGTASITYASALLVYNPSGAFVIATLLILMALASGAQYLRLEKFIRSQIAKGVRVRMRRDAERDIHNNE